MGLRTAVLASAFVVAGCGGTDDTGTLGNGGAGSGASASSSTAASTGNGTPLCVPGQQVVCPCPEGGMGAQVCKGDGSGYNGCVGCKVAGECDGPEDCPTVEEVCNEPTCVDGVCGAGPKPKGLIVPSGRNDDCKVIACDGVGGVEMAAVRPMGYECDDLPPSAIDRICDGQGNCVNCVFDEHCPSGYHCEYPACYAN